MAKVLGVLCTRRRRGNTGTLLKEAIQAASEVEGAEVEMLHLANYKFGPCLSSFWCLKNDGKGCCLRDDFGQQGEGEIFVKTKNANGVILADPVQFWSPSAMAHTYFERLYPFHWSDDINGIPFGSISCATNQGFQLMATQEICKWAFTMKLKYIGGIPAHTAQMAKMVERSRDLGRKVAEAAVLDEKEGRKKFTEQGVYEHYKDKPWKVYEYYFENLTDGKFEWEGSIIEESLRKGTFPRPEAKKLLEKAGEEFKEALKYYKEGDQEKAVQYLLEAGDFWTHGTWTQFVIDALKVDQPETYRPLEDAGEVRDV